MLRMYDVDELGMHGMEGQVRLFIFGAHAITAFCEDHCSCGCVFMPAVRGRKPMLLSSC